MWLGKPTELDMTPLGWLGRKTSTQTNQVLNVHIILLHDFILWIIEVPYDKTNCLYLFVLSIQTDRQTDRWQTDRQIDRQAWANNLNPDQMLQNVASDQDLHCLLPNQQFLAMPTGLYLDRQTWETV